MSYDPKASRPDTDDSEHAAPVDSLLGAPPEPGTTPETSPIPPGEAASLPEPVPTKRTLGAMIGAALALAVIFIGWRRRRR